MATLKEESMAYEPPQTLNIADLKKVPIDIELQNGEGKDNEGEVFKYKFAVVDGKQYRVPGSVIGQIKEILKQNPNTLDVVVTKQGTGMNTRYMVMPYVKPIQAEQVSGADIATPTQ